MPRERVVVTDFSAGQITESYAARVDLQAFRSAAASIKGMIVRPDGGVTRRPPSGYVRSGAGITPHAEGLVAPGSIPSFIMYSEQDGTNRMPQLALVASGGNIIVRNLDDGTEETIATGLTPGTTLATTGSFMAQDSFSTQYVQLWNDDGSELIDLQTRTTSPRTSKEIGVVFQNRLITADRAFGRIYFSVPLDLLNNDLTKEVSVTDSDGNTTQVTVPTGAIEIRADFYGVERIQWLAARGQMYLGTNLAEYELSSAYAGFNSEVGGVTVLPISPAGSRGAHYFGESLVLMKDRRLVRLQYSGREAQYQSSSMMELLTNAEVIQLASIDLGSHRYLFALDIQNNLWAYTESPGGQVGGWSLLEQDVWSIYSFDQDLYMVVERDGAFHIEVIGVDNLHYGGNRTPMDHLAYADLHQYSDQGGYIHLSASGMRQDPVVPNTSMNCYRYEAGAYTFIATRTSDANGYLFADSATARTFVGVSEPTLVEIHALPASPDHYESYIRTLPIEIATQEGPAIAQPTRITRIVVMVEETSAMDVRVSGGDWQRWTSEAGAQYSGPVSFTVQGGNREQTYVEVRSVEDNPLTIMSIQADVQKGSL